MEASKWLRRHIPGDVARSLQIFERLTMVGKQIVKQTRARIIRGETQSEGKLVSIFEPHTKIIRKGKKHKPTEFGRTVKVQEAEGGVVTDIAVVDVSDAQLVESSLLAHEKHFGPPPRVLAADRGFYSNANITMAREMGVVHVVIPKTGHRSDAARARAQTRTIPSWSRVACRRRSAHLTPQTNVRDGALSIPRRSGTREMHLRVR